MGLLEIQPPRLTQPPPSGPPKPNPDTWTEKGVLGLLKTAPNPQTQPPMSTRTPPLDPERGLRVNLKPNPKQKKGWAPSPSLETGPSSFKVFCKPATKQNYSTLWELFRHICCKCRARRFHIPRPKVLDEVCVFQRKACTHPPIYVRGSERF